MDEQQIIETVETATDAAVETVVPEVVESIEVVKNNPYILAGVALVAASSGVMLGYYIAEKRARLRYDTILEVELDKTKAHYERRIEDLEGSVHVEEPEVIINEVPNADRVVNKYGGVKVKGQDEVVSVETEVTKIEEDGDDVTVETTKTRNIFDSDVEEFDYKTEMAKRTDKHPFVITQEEFFENDEDNSQINLSYFAKDDILADEEDHTVDDVEGTVGTANLKRFGHGSKDRNIVYIRNPKTNTDYEVAYSPGSYMVEVLGMDEDDAG